MGNADFKENKNIDKEEVNIGKTISSSDYKELNYFYLSLRNKELEIINSEHEIKEHKNAIALINSKILNIKGQRRDIEKEYNDFLDKLEKENGVVVKGKIINPDTLEIFDSVEEAQARIGREGI